MKHSVDAVNLKGGFKLSWTVGLIAAFIFVNDENASVF